MPKQLPRWSREGAPSAALRAGGGGVLRRFGSQPQASPGGGARRKRKPHRTDVARLGAAECAATVPAGADLRAAVAALDLAADGDVVLCLEEGVHYVDDPVVVEAPPERGSGWLALRGDAGAVVSGGAVFDEWRPVGETWVHALKRSPPRVLFDGRDRVAPTRVSGRALAKEEGTALLFRPSVGNASLFAGRVEFVWTGLPRSFAEVRCGAFGRDDGLVEVDSECARVAFGDGPGRKRVRNSQLQRLLPRSFSTRFG